jgi:hypothetical protein
VVRCYQIKYSPSQTTHARSLRQRKQALTTPTTSTHTSNQHISQAELTYVALPTSSFSTTSSTTSSTTAAAAQVEVGRQAGYLHSVALEILARVHHLLLSSRMTRLVSITHNGDTVLAPSPVTQ